MIDLSHPDLFGNDAAEDETPEKLAFYFVDKDAFKTFRNPEVRLSIAKARKGIGKSAVLTYTAYTIESSAESAIVIQLKGSDLAAQRPLPPPNADALVFDWQQRICTAILNRIATSLNIAFDDDSMAIVEASELAGFKRRNILGALIDRIKIKVPHLGSIETEKRALSDSAAMLERYQSTTDRPHIWVFIDDIDATFVDSAEERLRLSSFFAAARALASAVDGLSIRSCVRSDVWAMVSGNEALDKVEQYLFEISWNEQEILAILAKRIRSFLHFNVDKNRAKLAVDLHEQRRAYMEEVFEPQFPWAGHRRPPHVVIDTLSHGRPRWAIQLCRMAARTAASAKHDRINLSDIDANLKEYGQKRFDDIIREHRHQCPQVAELISAFVKQPARYETANLITSLRNRVCTHLTPKIDGLDRREPMDIAHFLFRIGFLTARDDLDEEDFRHYTFEELPHLLSNRANPDFGYSWEIHPCYRQYLQLQGHIPPRPPGRRPR